MMPAYRTYGPTALPSSLILLRLCFREERSVLYDAVAVFYYLWLIKYHSGIVVYRFIRINALNILFYEYTIL